MADITDCSPERPWGLHPEIVENLCPRCGWSAGGPPPSAARSDTEAEPGLVAA